MAKSWNDKYNNGKEPIVKNLEKDFSDMQRGDRMLIATPKIIDQYIRQIPEGKKVDLKTMRKDLALDFSADNMCPLTTGIFLRIVVEKAYEEHQSVSSLDSITPFWRVLDAKSSLIKKLTFDIDNYLGLE